MAPLSGPGEAAVRVEALARSMGMQLVETHISWVLLGPQLVLKLKKPVRLPFVDYSTLQRRRHCCEEEVRLNRRLAPALYLGVSRITGPPHAPVLDGSGAPVEYAVRMRRFPPGALFGEQLAAGTLQPAAVDALAQRLAAFHEAAPADGAAPLPALQPGDRALAALDGAAALLDPAQRELLRQWIESEARRLQPLREQRRAAGRVRECHGDLHLDNVVTLDGAPAAFDGVEFDPALRWIDVVDDVAFTFMDFAARGRSDFAWRFLNGWLDHTGDHAALPLLRAAVVYRALVRAQVENLRAADAEAARRYASSAVAWAGEPHPALVIMCGLPGAGKTYVSQQLLEAQGAVRLRSDVERKRLFGLGMLDDSRSRGLDLYCAAANRRTYRLLLQKAAGALRAGYRVIIDAAFLRSEERRHARALAHGLGVPFTIVACKAPLPVLRRRLRERRGDASEATVQVLERLRELAEPLAGPELAFVRPPPAGHHP